MARPRYAKSIHDLDPALPVKADGGVMWVCGTCPGGCEALLVPSRAAAAWDGAVPFGEAMRAEAVCLPVRRLRLPEGAAADRDTLRALFRLDLMPWDAAERGDIPLSSTGKKYVFSEDDLLCLISRLPLFKNGIIWACWRAAFLHPGPGARPGDDGDAPGFSFAFFAGHFMSLMEWHHPEEDGPGMIRELRDAYLLSKGRPLSEMTLPDWLREDMALELEEYAQKHPVTGEMRAFYAFLLDTLCREGGADGALICARAYLYGNALVPRVPEKAAGALLRLFDPRTKTGAPWAAYALGCIYSDGSPGPADHEKAFVCFSYAAACGHAEAVCRLSDMYRLGLFAKKDPERAFSMVRELYRMADKREPARGSYADICLRMGYCLRDGTGTAKDPARAESCFREALRAIDARLKTCPEYGDEEIKREILAALTVPANAKENTE